MLNLTITTIQDEKDLSLLLDFMYRQPQYYPGYSDWLYGKCCSRLESGKYIPIVALNDGIVVGDAVYQYLDASNVELKNFRIDPKYQNRDLGHFILRQVEHETERKDIILDVSVDNFEGVEFFIHNGFKITKKNRLYSKTKDEYIMKRIF